MINENLTTEQLMIEPSVKFCQVPSKDNVYKGLGQPRKIWNRLRQIAVKTAIWLKSLNNHLRGVAVYAIACVRSNIVRAAHVVTTFRA